MSDQSDNEQKAFIALSAVADGEATANEVAQACAAWAGDADSRERWHSYQLIGDALRSDTLLDAGRRSDRDFLESFRERLADEPVVLAPAALAAARAAGMPPAALAPHQQPSVRRRHWAGPTAVAAGFVLVLGAVVTTLNGGSLGGGAGNPALLAQSGSSDASSLQVPGMAQGWVGQEAALEPSLRNSLVADNAMGQRTSAAAPPSFTQHVTEGPTAHAGNLVVIRDAQLDQLLAAHREFSQTGAFAPPAGLVRSVAFEAPAR